MIAHASSRSVHGEAAFTLVETMLALTLASLVGVTLLSMLRAFAVSTGPRFSMREAIVNREVAILRAGALLRPSGTILDASSNKIALWTGDENGDNLPNLRELRLIEFRQATGEVWLFDVPEGSSSVSDTPYSLSTNFVTALEGLADSQQLPGRLMLTDVAEWQLDFDNASPRSARVARLRTRSSLESGLNESTTVVSLRCAPSP